MASSLTDRLSAAAKAAGDAGVDALLITPGADLRYLVGYHALPLERLTCLLVPATGEPVLIVPLLEQPAAEASGAGDQRPGGHARRDGRRLRARGGAASRTPLGGPRRPSSGWPTGCGPSRCCGFRDTHAGQADQVAAGACCARCGCARSPTRSTALRRAGQAIDRVHARMGEWLRPGRTEASVGRDIADAILAEGHASVNFTIVAVRSERRQPAPRAVRPGHRGRGPGRRRHRWHHAGRLLLGLHPHLRRRQDRRQQSSPTYYAVLLDAQQASCESVRPGVTAQQRRRRRARRHRRGRVRRAVHPPHRSRDRSRGARGAVDRRRQRDDPGARDVLLDRAGHLRRAATTAPGSRTSSRSPMDGVERLDTDRPRPRHPGD